MNLQATNEGEHEMSIRLNALCLGALLTLSLLGAKPALANDINKKTIFQFDVPVEIPGRVLAPGKYVFKIADTSDLNVVQVYSEDATGHDNLIDTIAATPEHVGKTPNAPIINYEDLPGHPKAIRSWFAAGDNWGWRFIYPTDK
jgi:hypothetical protein